MKKLFISFILINAINANAVVISPPYIAVDYESDDVYQVCGSPDVNKIYTCSLLNKTDFVVKPDGRVISGEMQIEFGPDSTGTMVGSITKNQQITVDCLIKNISYGSDATGWSPWQYLEPNTVGHMIMTKLCSLKK